MKVLMISTDRKIFEPNSEVRERMLGCGEIFDELKIVIFTPKGFKEEKIGNVWLYPTNSCCKYFHPHNSFYLSKRLLKEKRVDLISTQDPFETGFVGFVLSRVFKIPWQVQVHTDFLNPYFKRESLLNRTRVLVAKLLLPRARRIRVVSNKIKQSIVNDLKISESKIDVLPVFVDTEKIKNTPIKTDLHKKYPQFDFIILMASRLTKEKNIGLAIKAFRKVVLKHPKAGLVIVGEGPEKQRLVSDSGQLSDNIIIEPWTDDLISYYKTADLFLLTSNYEGYGRTIVEAIESGCNVISTEVGTADEVLEKENIIKTGDGEGLAEKLTNAIGGGIKKPKNLPSITREQFLEKYKKLSQKCLNSYENVNNII